MTNVTQDPPLIINPPKQPLFSLRRLVIVLLIAGATAFLVFAWHGAPDTGGGTGCNVAAVQVWTPCPGGRVLRQSSIGVQFKPGYDGRITINGIAIPEDQMDGAILPGSDAYNRLTPDERALGPRPNTKNLVAFTPGDGKAIDKFVGQLDVLVTYWRQEDGPGDSQTLSYTVFVT